MDSKEEPVAQLTDEETEHLLPHYLAAVCEHDKIRRGNALPFGPHPAEEGVNFSFFSRSATRVRLEFFNHPNDQIATKFVDLDPIKHRTGDVWHVWIKDIQPGQLYGYRVDGPYEPGAGYRFNFEKLLLDPYATAVTPVSYWDFNPALGYTLPDKQELPSKVNDTGDMPKCVFTHDHFDWGKDHPLRHPWSEMVIYETHVRGLTFDASAEVAHPGTFRGLIEKIPYLKELGITAVELMPIHEFNDSQVKTIDPQTHQPLRNYWGYDPVAFLAPKASYSSSGGLGQQKLEFKEMVKALHAAGIEVILDVVFNHTAEGDERGPTFCFRGIDNSIFYMLQDDKHFYKNYTGTGNTINGNHPVVREFILSALRYWALAMHIDGFRFDLATILGRDQAGNFLSTSPLLEQIAEDPILRNVKLIAEAWDIAGSYELGKFSGLRWAEWNGLYRDDVRSFWRGDQGKIGAFAKRICGSQDIYAPSGKGPENSINFVTCHDGFTLNDLVSYNQKHNERNGQNNQDGADVNYSANYGIEGPTDHPDIEAVRIRQIKNFLLTLFISRGVPMLLGGDEFRRTQQGNNNAYCQDNIISWYDWTFLKKNAEIFRFAQGMIAFRKAHPIFSKEKFYTEDEIQWFNADGFRPDWFDPNEKRLGALIFEGNEAVYYLMFNAHETGIDFILPMLAENRAWFLAVTTAGASPNDLILKEEQMPLVDANIFHVQGRSSVILIARYKA